ncbi:polysaccharide deacetylase family protein [Nocardioides sp. HM23]|uniref:polysaccharide deacetylase family protein n=1 Tax=Nocardioides bizhenqiangii TaxID=3095076 RepID=UPI002ACAA278|nr:polysaccharide deacetylase family protein [Nocardioides sp. HM23]MDZ5620784.1 polysaccharide deacetylase family protein [Nocardioides sp. HM23]
MPLRAPRAAVLVGVVGLLLTSVVAPRADPAAAQVAGSRGGCTGRIALTFDDGPASGPTDQLLRILRDRGVPATFFMVGQRVVAAPRLTRAVERGGFLIANHSWAHVRMTTQTRSEVAASLRTTTRALRRVGTHPTGLMRPPYGALDAAARDGVRDAGLVPVLWNVDSRDWESGTASQIAARILAQLRPGANIVLQHDGVTRSPISIAAVPRVVRGARQRGYCFTALDERGRPGFPTPRVSVSVTDAAEGRHAVATIRLTRPPGRTTSVRVRTVSRTARIGQDVQRMTRRVGVPAGRLTVRVPIAVVRDGTDEPLERFAVRITRPRGLALGRDVAVGQVRDRNVPPLVRGADVTVPEPAADTVVPVTFTLARPSGRQIRFVLRTVAGSADGTDFVRTRQDVVLAPGGTSVELPVTVLADSLGEPDETFRVEVVRARNVRIGRPSTVTIAAPQP